MGRLGRVNAGARGWRRDQTCVQKDLITGPLKLYLLRLIGFAVRVGFQLFAQVVCCPHRSTLAIRRAKPREGKPCFIPKENKVRLNRKAFFHDPLHVVDQTVKGTVRQKQHADAVKLTCGLQRQQLMLDFLERHGAIHRVFIQRIAVEIDNLGPSQNHAVVVRFVAIAVDQNNVTGAHKRLNDDLVTGRCTVGGKERLL